MLISSISYLYKGTSYLAARIQLFHLGRCYKFQKTRKFARRLKSKRVARDWHHNRHVHTNSTRFITGTNKSPRPHTTVSYRVWWAIQSLTMLQTSHRQRWSNNIDELLSGPETARENHPPSRELCRYHAHLMVLIQATFFVPSILVRVLIRQSTAVKRMMRKKSK